MRAATIAMLVVMAACRTRGPFVDSIHIHGRELVVERCEIEFSDDEIKAQPCTTKTLVIPEPTEAGSAEARP